MKEVKNEEVKIKKILQAKSTLLWKNKQLTNGKKERKKERRNDRHIGTMTGNNSKYCG